MTTQWQSELLSNAPSVCLVLALLESSVLTILKYSRQRFLKRELFPISS